MPIGRIKSLLRRDPGVNRRVPPGLRVYAIGDIHGRLDLFEQLLALVERDRASWKGEVEVVLLGDYVDRGPDSSAVLDRLAGELPSWAIWTLLKGNHEQSMLDAVEGRAGGQVLRAWLEYGGRETLRSYGTPPRIALGDDEKAITAELRSRVPVAHLRLLRSLKLSRRIGDYFFVHAGIRPGVALDAQADLDLLWIRNEFLDCRDDHGCVVVHGHSITRDVSDLPNRIGIDTGAYASGRLTALVLEGDQRRYIAT